jgi:hypothetical protein
MGFTLTRLFAEKAPSHLPKLARTESGLGSVYSGGRFVKGCNGAWSMSLKRIFSVIGVIVFAVGIDVSLSGQSSVKQAVVIFRNDGMRSSVMGRSLPEVFGALKSKYGDEFREENVVSTDFQSYNVIIAGIPD